MSIQFACRCRFGLSVPEGHETDYRCRRLEEAPGGYLRTEHTVPVCEVPYCSHGDYLGGSVERSNYKVWEEMFEASEGVLWIPIRYDFGGHSVWVRAGIAKLADSSRLPSNLNTDCQAGEMIQVIHGLAAYPCIDDEHLSNMEMEEAGEAWSGMVARDFIRAIEKNLGDDSLVLEDESRSEVLSTLWELYQSYGGENESPHDEGGGNYVFPHLEEAALRVTREDYEKLCKL